jgi:hypothetical protein
MDLSELAEFNDPEEYMALSEAFLTWEREKEMQTKEAIAIKMLQEGATLEFVVKVTGWTIAQIQALQAQAEEN